MKGARKVKKINGGKKVTVAVAEHVELPAPSAPSAELPEPLADAPPRVGKNERVAWCSQFNRYFVELHPNGVFSGLSIVCKHKHQTETDGPQLSCRRDLRFGKKNPMPYHEANRRLLAWAEDCAGIAGTDERTQHKQRGGMLLINYAAGVEPN